MDTARATAGSGSHPHFYRQPQPVGHPPQEHGFVELSVTPFTAAHEKLDPCVLALTLNEQAPLIPSIWGCGEVSPDSHGQVPQELANAPAIQAPHWKEEA